MNTNREQPRHRYRCNKVSHEAPIGFVLCTVRKVRKGATVNILKPSQKMAKLAPMIAVLIVAAMPLSCSRKASSKPTTIRRLGKSC